MDVPPELPALAVPYACVVQASDRYSVPKELLYAIVHKEGGYPGAQVKNRDGSWDYGLAQINSQWLPQLTQYGITSDHLRWDACVNLGVSAWILAQNYRDTGRDWVKAIQMYNVGSAKTEALKRIGYRYSRDVIQIWHSYHRKFNPGLY